MDPLVQVPVIRIPGYEVLTTSAALKTDRKLPLAQLAGKTSQMFLLLICSCHEPEKLGGRRHQNFTIVKSPEPAA